MRWVLVACLGLMATPTGLSETSAGGEPAALTFELAPLELPEGFDSEAEYLDRYGRWLLARAEAAEGALGEMQQRLAAANWILSVGIEPFAGRYLLDLSTPADMANMRAGVETALEQLARCRQLYDEYEVDEEDDAQLELIDRLDTDAETLGAFAAALVALVDAEQGSDNDIALRQASVKLSIQLEDDRVSVQAGAQLWQGVVMRRRGQPDRAVEVIGMVLAEPREGAKGIDFFAKLLRCRCLADRGQYVTAASLLMKLESRCLDSFDSEEVRHQRERTALVQRLDVLRRWGADFDERGLTHRRDWCLEKVKKLCADRFGDVTKVELARLGAAVPLLVDVPPYELPKIEPSPPSSQPVADEAMGKPVAAPEAPDTQPVTKEVDEEHREPREE